MTIDQFQDLIEQTYFERDSARGLEGTFMWFAEEVGELARALHRSDEQNLKDEFADVFAWLSTLASIKGVRLSDCVAKYADGCPVCKSQPCACGPK
jgi:NTP pyrophosphatase (non-canonical NTP hydrolase)